MRNQSGYTLIELIVALSIVGIIVAIAVPNWVRWIPSYRLKAASRDLVSNFQKAKTEAVRRNVNVVLSFDLVNGTYSMFVDDGDGGGTPDNFIQDGSELLLGNHDMPGLVTLASASFSGGTQQAGFTSRGLPAGGRIGTATLSNTKGITRDIALSITGNIRIQ